MILWVYYNPNTYFPGMSPAKQHVSLSDKVATCHWHLLPRYSVMVVQLIDFSFCNNSWNNLPSWLVVYNKILCFILSAMYLVLTVTKTLKESVMMYKAIKKWQPNQYMQQLVKDGILYFLMYVSILSTHPCFHPPPSHIHFSYILFLLRFIHFFYT